MNQDYLSVNIEIHYTAVEKGVNILVNYHLFVFSLLDLLLLNDINLYEIIKFQIKF